MMTERIPSIRVVGNAVILYSTLSQTKPIVGYVFNGEALRVTQKTDRYKANKEHYDIITLLLFVAYLKGEKTL